MELEPVFEFIHPKADRVRGWGGSLVGFGLLVLLVSAPVVWLSFPALVQPAPPPANCSLECPEGMPSWWAEMESNWERGQEVVRERVRRRAGAALLDSSRQVYFDAEVPIGPDLYNLVEPLREVETALQAEMVERITDSVMADMPIRIAGAQRVYRHRYLLGRHDRVMLHSQGMRSPIVAKTSILVALLGSILFMLGMALRFWALSRRPFTVTLERHAAKVGRERLNLADPDAVEFLSALSDLGHVCLNFLEFQEAIDVRCRALEQGEPPSQRDQRALGALRSTKGANGGQVRP